MAVNSHWMAGDVHQTEAFLARLGRLGVRVSQKDGQLRCTGPEMLLRGELGAEIRDRKAQLLAFLAEASAPVADRVADLPEAKGPPVLSPAQIRLWVAEQISPDMQHHIPFVLKAHGTPDPAQIVTALRRVTERHDVLRLRITADTGQPVMHIAPSGEVPLQLLDVAPDQVDAVIADAISRPFDLANAPPIRLCILRGDPAFLILTLHHIAADGTSVELLMRDFAAAYAGGDLPPLARQYTDYAALPHMDAGHLAFWREALSDLPVTRLPTDMPRPAHQDMTGGLHPLALPADLTGQLRQIGAAHGASLYSVLFAAFHLLVSRYTSEHDLVIGTPMANRATPATRDMIGLFVNTLPLRCQIDPEKPFTDLLARLHRQHLQVMAHQDISFEALADMAGIVRDPAASPLFQLKFQLDRAVDQTLNLPGLSLTRMARQPGMAQHDLSLDLIEGPAGVTGHFDYATALFRPETIARMAGHFETLLRAIVAHPDRPVILLDLLTEEEKNCAREIWNQSAFPLDPAERFPALFEAQARTRPDAIAVEYIGSGQRQSESYAGLNSRANRLAHWLRAQGCGPGHVVGISMQRGPDLAAAWLGVLKSGAAYLPLDCDYPADRLAYMLTDSGTRLVLTQSALPLPDGITQIDLDTSWPEGDSHNPEAGTDPGDLAYVIYTSGSTGQPKGVEVPHGGLVNLTRDKIRKLDVRPGDRVLSFFSFSFDAHIPDFVMSLGAGGRLIFAPPEDILPGPGLAATFRRSRATHLTITPSALAATPEDNLPDLRCVLVGGEAPAPELIARWSAGRLFVNGYGPTETTVNASMVPCGGDHPVDPSLKPPANKQLYVLGRYMELLPIGCPGELYIGGVGLAHGYRGRPGQTAAAFVPDPFRDGARLYRTGDAVKRLPDGRIRYLGRLDDQVKLRGYRIEPGEIARAIGAFDGIKSAHCGIRDLGGKARLIGWFVGPEADETALKRHLKATLPRHMWPDHLIRVPAMPLTVNGKTDVKALPGPRIGAATARPPAGPTQSALANIFADLLSVDAPGAEDDFFDLGGTSLLATRLVAMVEDRLGHRLRVMDLFDASSIGDLARRIDGEALPLQAPLQAPWQEDLILDPAMQPGPHRESGDVLLTGATGFVGMHLLAALLAEPGQRVLCLLRDGGEKRLVAALQQAGLWQDSFTGRIVSVGGDLETKGLGLSAPDRARLANVATIYHGAARVHHASPYRQLRGPNVQGTREIIRLACDTGATLHYLSTLSALTPRAHQITETDAAQDFDAPEGGYNQSKWVAEQLVAQAAARGLRVTIHRLGAIAPAKGGALNPDDILMRQLQGYLDLGRAPEGQALINILPVDYAIQALLKASGGAASGQVFHLTHSRPVPSDMLFDACAAEGRPLTRIRAADWQAEMSRIARHNPQHPLFALAGLGGAQGFTGAFWPYSADQTRKALAGLWEPPLTIHLLRDYVRALLKEPASCPAQ